MVVELQTLLSECRQKWYTGDTAAVDESAPVNRKEWDRALNRLEDKLLERPLDIVDEFEDLGGRFLARFASLTVHTQTKLASLIAQLLHKLVGVAGVNVQERTNADLSSLQNALNCTLILAHIGCLRLSQDPSTVLEHLKVSIAESLRALLSLPLGRLCSLSDVNSMVAVAVRTVHLFLEQPDTLKHQVLLDTCLSVLATSVVAHRYAGVETLILQDLTFHEHLAEPLAKLLGTLASDSPQTCESVLMDLGHHNFTSSEGNTPKIVAGFLVALAGCNARCALRNLHHVLPLLDVEATAVRMALLDVLGKLIADCLTGDDNANDEEEDPPNSESNRHSQIRTLFNLIEERLRDVNAFVRCKALQVLADLVRSQLIPVSRRHALIDLVALRVRDKSSNVRKRALQFLGDTVRSHPFGVDGGELDLIFFQGRLQHIDDLLKELDSDSTMHDMDDPDRIQRINQLLMQRRYYQDAEAFVVQLDRLMPTLALLLSSTVKTELVELMDFATECALYKVRSAPNLVRRMIALVWEKDANAPTSHNAVAEEGRKSVKDHLVACYTRLYVCMDDRLSPRERLIETTQNLIRMMDGLTLGEMACVEELIGLMVRRRVIPDSIALVLLNLTANPDVQDAYRQDALRLLNCLLKARHTPEPDNVVEVLVRVAFGPLSQVSSPTCLIDNV